MNPPLIFFSVGMLILASTSARPQDIGTGMMLAMGQIQQMAETGGGLRNEQSVEVMGQKMNGGLNLGFGEVMQLPMGRRRRSALEYMMDIEY